LTKIAPEGTTFEGIWTHQVEPFGGVEKWGEPSRKNFNKW
jgi:hypothetical protein